MDKLGGQWFCLVLVLTEFQVKKDAFGRLRYKCGWRDLNPHPSLLQRGLQAQGCHKAVITDGYIALPSSIGPLSFLAGRGMM